MMLGKYVLTFMLADTNDVEFADSWALRAPTLPTDNGLSMHLAKTLHCNPALFMFVVKRRGDGSSRDQPFRIVRCQNSKYSPVRARAPFEWYEWSDMYEFIGARPDWICSFADKKYGPSNTPIVQMHVDYDACTCEEPTMKDLAAIIAAVMDYAGSKTQHGADRLKCVVSKQPLVFHRPASGSASK